MRVVKVVIVCVLWYRNIAFLFVGGFQLQVLILTLYILSLKQFLSPLTLQKSTKLFARRLWGFLWNFRL